MASIPEWFDRANEVLPPSQLCASCHEAVQDEVYGTSAEPPLYFHLDAPRDFHRSLEIKCRACALLAYHALTRRSAGHGRRDVLDDDDYTWIAEQHSIQPIDFRFWKSHGLFLIPEKQYPRRLDLWKHWLKTCSESHKTCSTAAKLAGERLASHKTSSSSSQPMTPERLVEIMTSDARATLAWRVVRGRDVGNNEYLTLSHCWGSSQPLKLTKKNYDSMLRLNYSSILPRTFQHAISVAHAMGFRYIWIDSLCIVQDDLKDWEEEASKMSSIYQDARLNIVAAWNTGSDDGLFAKRDRSPTITVKTADGEATKYILRDGLLFHDDIINSSLSKRGWVTQERYLSIRQLSFAKGQVYWECQQTSASEDFPNGIPEMVLGHNEIRTLRVKSEKGLRRVWGMLVTSYSSCAFSKLSDRVMALAGLADQVRNATNDIYLAGLWRKNLILQLYWRVISQDSVRTSAYFAPSWSWLSVTGQVVNGFAYAYSINVLACSQVLQANTVSKHHSGLHNFIEAKLVLQGILLSAQAILKDEAESYWTEARCIISELNCTASRMEAVGIYCDIRTSSRAENRAQWRQQCEDRNSHLVCILLHVDNYSVCGLLLQRTSSDIDEDIYTRVGTLEKFNRDFKVWLASKLECQPSELPTEGEIDFEDPRLQSVVRTITIV